MPSEIIALTATFTAEPLREPISFWMAELGLDLEVSFAPYNQVFQELLDPASLLSRNKGGVNVVLARAEDWQREGGGIAAWGAEVEAKIDRILGELTDAIGAAASRAGGSAAPHLVAICPPSAAAMADASRAAFLRGIEDRFAARLAAERQVLVITSQEIAELYPVREVSDPHADEIGHIPYSAAFFAALGTIIARKIHAIRTPRRKAIAVDCDETLWKGVVGEVGPLGVEMAAPHRAVQEALLRQKESGVVLCIASKNAEEDVLDVWKDRSDMLLRREDFVASRINWQKKSESLREIAGELGLGLDSFVFLDDNPVECAEVGAICPEVLTLALPPPEEDIPAFLRHVWAFDHLRVTDEDRRRTEMYAQNAERERLREGSLTLGDFLAGLGIEVSIAEVSGAQIARVSQLTQRTNQFNATTRRRSEAEIAEIARGEGEICLAVEVKDRFGDYGLVGVMIAAPAGEAILVDTFLLSCRVLGRGVENRMLRKLGEIATARGLARVDVPFLPTKKNQPARDFLEGAGARHRAAEGDGQVFRFPAAEAAAIALTPFVGEIAETGGGAGGEKVKSSGSAAPSALINRIARDLRDVDAILAAIAAYRRASAGAPVEAANGPVEEEAASPALTPVEEKIAEIWSEVLAVDGIGVGQDFFELGGDSLTAARVLARLRQAFPVQLPHDVLFEARTIGRLAEIVMEALAEQGDEMDDLLREIEGG